MTKLATNTDIERLADAPCSLRVLDLFCAAGGASMGLHRAGFDVMGIDINPQPHYPFKFELGDAMEADLSDYDLVWASPPCQAHSEMQKIHKNASDHPDLIEPMRKKLEEWGGLWIMENVANSPLKSHTMLCGSMFGLRIIKHRYFEANFELPFLLPPCDHSDVYDPWHGKGRTAEEFRAAQDTPWIPMQGGASRKAGITGDVSNAIPPAYSEFLAGFAMTILKENVKLSGDCEGEHNQN
jgi:DNA (cytosine-5)-methyltransferase 1